MRKATSHVDQIARIKVSLDQTKPVVWRRVEIPLTTNLKGVHDVVQAVMLFENYHLFDFHALLNGRVDRWGIPDTDRFVQIADAKNVKLGSLVARGVTSFAYCYDFGDNWEHTLAIEAITAADPNVEYPRFVDGERRAPPEYVGGIPGFEEFLEAMSKPRHPDHDRMVEWYGRRFNSDDIDVKTIKTRIGKIARRRSIGKANFAKNNTQ